MELKDEDIQIEDILLEPHPYGSGRGNLYLITENSIPFLVFRRRDVVLSTSDFWYLTKKGEWSYLPKSQPTMYSDVYIKNISLHTLLTHDELERCKKIKDP